MFAPLLIAYCLLNVSTSRQQSNHIIVLKDSTSGQDTGEIEERLGQLAHPQFSPRLIDGERSEFDWQTIAFEKITSKGVMYPRFSVFSQDRKPTNDTAVSVARMLERLWEYNKVNLGRDNPQMFNEGLIDVYVCKGGKAGGEQRIDADIANSRDGNKVNTIYFYDLDTFSDPIEMAREVAHEFGHASLLDVANGYSEPENWSNGYLGEKLFLGHMLEQLQSKQLSSEDLMGVTEDSLQTWVKMNVTPLIIKAASEGSNLHGLKLRDKQGMDNFIGLALYIDKILPEKRFNRSLQLLPSNNAEDYPEAIVTAIEAETVTLRIPSYLADKPIWIPLGSSHLSGTPILEKKNGWVKIRPGTSKVKLTAVEQN